MQYELAKTITVDIDPEKGTIDISKGRNNIHLNASVAAQLHNILAAELPGMTSDPGRKLMWQGPKIVPLPLPKY